MGSKSSSSPLQIFSTSPQSKECGRTEYLRKVIESARWSEDLGYAGTLVYTDNGLVDPWLVSQVILANTERIAPLVAVQPLYMHPYAVAKMIATLGHFYGRRLFLNMLAGGFKNDLTALGDGTPHDERYLKATEYAQVIMGLLRSKDGFTFEGRYYQVKNLKITPPLPPELLPGLLISGSSQAGMEAAEVIGAVGVRYPKPPGDEDLPHDTAVKCGIRVGIIARASTDEACRIGHQRFPEDRRGELTHQLAMKVSDSIWHQQLSDIPKAPRSVRNPYWLHPFQTHKSFCPYLVGDYDATAREVANYISLGFQTFILDIPTSYDDLEHTRIVFERALESIH